MKPIEVRQGAFDDATAKQLEQWLNGGPDGLKAFKAWAVRRPIRWDIGLPTKEAAEMRLAKFQRGRERNRSGHGVLYVVQVDDGTWEMIESPLTEHFQELPQ